MASLDLYTAILARFGFSSSELFVNSMLLNEKPFGRQIGRDGCKSYQYNVCIVLRLGCVCLFVVCNFFFNLLRQKEFLSEAKGLLLSFGNKRMVLVGALQG